MLTQRLVRESDGDDDDDDADGRVVAFVTTMVAIMAMCCRDRNGHGKGGDDDDDANGKVVVGDVV